MPARCPVEDFGAMIGESTLHLRLVNDASPSRNLGPWMTISRDPVTLDSVRLTRATSRMIPQPWRAWPVQERAWRGMARIGFHASPRVSTVVSAWNRVLRLLLPEQDCNGFSSRGPPRQAQISLWSAAGEERWIIFAIERVCTLAFTPAAWHANSHPCTEDSETDLAHRRSRPAGRTPGATCSRQLQLQPSPGSVGRRPCPQARTDRAP